MNQPLEAAQFGHPALPSHGNPFPGLRPFHEDEEHLFFGREHQVDAMVDKLAATRFLAVIGSSGSGKSSLVNCGLRPALRLGLHSRAGNAWRMAQFRPGSRPIHAMAEALGAPGLLFDAAPPGGLSLQSIVETSLNMSRLGLQDVVEQARLAPGVNLLIVVDQFEELFRYRAFSPPQMPGRMSAAEEATAFVNLLLDAVQQKSVPIHIVLTMRSDFLGDCTQFPGLAEAINAGQYLVPRMTRDERRLAIAGPVSVGGAKISSVLLNQLVNDVGDNPDQLSILQHAMNRTWAHWEEDRATGKPDHPLDLPHYQKAGTMAHALDRHAERAFGELQGERLQAVCEKVFRALTDKATDPRGVRRPTTLERLGAIADASPQELEAVLEVFRKPSRSFLMPPAGESLQPQTVIDISHESLMRVWQRLNGWADAEALSAQTYRRLADTAALHQAGKASLWRDPDLAQVLQWREREAVNAAWAGRYGSGFEQALAFLQDSERARDAETLAARQREEAQRLAQERELAQALALAEEQRQRAEEQAHARQRQKRLNRMLVGLLAVCVAAGGMAAWSWMEAAKMRQAGREAADDLANLRLNFQQLSAALAEARASQGTQAHEQAAQRAAALTQDVLAMAGADAKGSAAPSAQIVADVQAGITTAITPPVAGAAAQAAPAPAKGDKLKLSTSPGAGTAKATAPAPAVAAAPPPPVPAPAPAVVAAPGPSPTGSASPGPAAGDRLTMRWALASGGCLKGAVTVSGPAVFWVETQKDGRRVARSSFSGTGNGFTVKAGGESAPGPAGSGAFTFEIKSQAEWKGPDKRQFRSEANERLLMAEGGRLLRATMGGFRTLCSD
ncbi:MAG: hypothetical protein JNJ71_11530 [Rubrivivax sp.]|nr:hypothetical protein [Rubrivivax sp.]